MPLQSVIMYLAQSEAETSLATDTTMGLSTIVNVLPSCCAVNNTANIQVIVTSAQSGTLTDRNIVVFRLK